MGAPLAGQVRCAGKPRFVPVAGVDLHSSRCSTAGGRFALLTIGTATDAMNEDTNEPRSVYADDREDFAYGQQRQKRLDAGLLTGKWVVKTDGKHTWRVRQEV